MTHRLCYAVGPWLYFTKAPLKLQWGDDWDDSPHLSKKTRPSDILVIGHLGDYTVTQGDWSVRDLNAKLAPWLTSLDPKCKRLWAGASAPKVIQVLLDQREVIYYNPRGAGAGLLAKMLT